ncbi:MAG: hypothetical protein ABFE01_23220, partial [Phycisphaerales bacterium]
MKRIRRGVGVCVVLGLCIPLVFCFAAILPGHGEVRLSWNEAVSIDAQPVPTGYGPARQEGDERPASGVLLTVFGDDVNRPVVDANAIAAEPCEPSSFIGPVYAAQNTRVDANRPATVQTSANRPAGGSGDVPDANRPGAAVTAVSDPNVDAPGTMNELVGFVVRGRMAHERLQIDDLDSLLMPNGERRLPLLRILRAFQVTLQEQGGVFRFTPEGVGPIELDVPGGQIQIKDRKREIKLIQAVSDVTLKPDIYLRVEDLDEILDVKLEWNNELYEYRIQMDRSLSIWAVTANGPLNLTDIQYMGADLPSVLPAADRSRDALQFVQLDWQTGYGWHHTTGSDSDVHRVTFGSPRETLWGNVYDGQYKLRMSHPAANWSSGNGLDWTNEEPYAARLDWFEWVRRLPSAEITLGDASSGLSDLVCPIITTTGVRVNGLIGCTPEEMASDRSRLGLRQYFGRPLLFEGPAPIGATVELVLNGRKIGTQSVVPEPGSPPGMGLYRFEDIELAYGILNEVTLVIKEINGNEIRVEKTMMGTPQLVPKGRTAYLGLAGTRRDRRIDDIPTVDAGEASGYLAGGRILHGVTDRLTLGLTAAGQQDYFRRYTEDAASASRNRIYPDSSQHGGVTLSYMPFDKLLLSSDLAGSQAQDSEGYGDLAARVRADYLPTQKLSFNVDVLNLGSDYFDGVDPEVADRRGGEVGTVWRWNKLWTLEAGLGEVGDNVDGDRDDTLVVDYRSVGLTTTALPRSSLTAKLHNLHATGADDDATLLELRLRISPIRDISVYGQIFTGDDIEVEGNDRFLSSLRLRNAPRFLHPSQYWAVTKRFNRTHMTSVAYGTTEDQDILSIAHDVRLTVNQHPLNLRAELIECLSGQSEGQDRLRFRADYMLDPFGNNQFGATAEFSDDSYAVYCYMSIQSLFACHRNRLVHVNESRIRTAYGAIQGRVFLDYNGNHVLDVNEPGVPDVKVSLNQLTSAVTDKKGYYILSTPGNASEARVYLDAETVPAMYTVTNGAQTAKVYRDSLTEVNLSVAPLISLTGRVVAVDPNAANRNVAEPNIVDPNAPEPRTVDANAPELSPTVLDGADANSTNTKPAVHAT